MRHGTIETFDLDDYLGRAHWQQTYPAGRVCAYDGCATILSVYNEEHYCGAHRPEPPLHYCGMDFQVCHECGALSQVRAGQHPRRCGRCGAERGAT